MTQRHKKPEILHTEIVAKSRLFQIEQVHLKFSNGVERQYERMKGGSRG
ncbi:MAG: ADP-ribose diphosphatase, partial [Shewanella sp.]